MTADQKQAAYEHLRSIALQAHQAIEALKKDNYGEAVGLVGDIEYDMTKLEELLPEVET
jgi:hypothetical protein